MSPPLKEGRGVLDGRATFVARVSHDDGGWHWVTNSTIDWQSKCLSVVEELLIASKDQSSYGTYEVLSQLDWKRLCHGADLGYGSVGLSSFNHQPEVVGHLSSGLSPWSRHFGPYFVS